jgi:D-tyrosyl-tRNA(Tyr) deacylase
LLEKILGLRIFENEAGKMDKSVVDAGGALLVVSQFTLFADVHKGRRPSFDGAAPPEEANMHYTQFVEEARRSLAVETGRFRATMDVHLVNDGPVTLLLDSRAR